jgi:hypothetical protein
MTGTPAPIIGLPKSDCTCRAVSSFHLNLSLELLHKAESDKEFSKKASSRD